MKRTLILAFIFASFAVFAQEKVEPTFVEVDNQIEATYYHNNGKVAQKGLFCKEGKLQGTWKSYDANGNKVAIGNYKDGQKVGKWYFWTENDIKVVDYEVSKIVAVNKLATDARVAIAD